MITISLDLSHYETILNSLRTTNTLKTLAIAESLEHQLANIITNKLAQIKSKEIPNDLS